MSSSKHQVILEIPLGPAGARYSERSIIEQSSIWKAAVKELNPALRGAQQVELGHYLRAQGDRVVLFLTIHESRQLSLRFGAEGHSETPDHRDVVREVRKEMPAMQSLLDKVSHALLEEEFGALAPLGVVATPKLIKRNHGRQALLTTEDSTVALSFPKTRTKHPFRESAEISGSVTAVSRRTVQLRHVMRVCDGIQHPLANSLAVSLPAETPGDSMFVLAHATKATSGIITFGGDLLRKSVESEKYVGMQALKSEVCELTKCWLVTQIGLQPTLLADSQEEDSP